jgi:hypothetical protein
MGMGTSDNNPAFGSHLREMLVFPPADYI